MHVDNHKTWKKQKQRDEVPYLIFRDKSGIYYWNYIEIRAEYITGII